MLAMTGSMMNVWNTHTIKAKPFFAPLPEDYTSSGKEWNEPSTVRIATDELINSLVDHTAAKLIFPN